MSQREEAIFKSALTSVSQYISVSIESAEGTDRSSNSAVSLDCSFQEREGKGSIIVSSVAISKQIAVESELGDR